jgi:hypothetical protein
MVSRAVIFMLFSATTLQVLAVPREFT